MAKKKRHKDDYKAKHVAKKFKRVKSIGPNIPAYVRKVKVL